MPSVLRSAPLPVVALCVALLGTDARAQDKESCLQAHEQGQRLRAQGKLRAAQKDFEICSRDVCPPLPRGDCSGWAAETEASLASVVIEALDAQRRPLVDVAVYVDDERVADRVDGAPIVVDPGTRTFRFEAADGARMTRTVTVAQGQKNVVVQVDFSTLGPAPALPVTAAPRSTASPPPRRLPDPAPAGDAPLMPPAAWVLGALGVAGVVGFGVFAAIGKDRENDLVDGCAPGCPDRDVDTMYRFYAAADVSLGIGVAGLIAATVVVLATPKPRPAGSRAFLGVSPASGGGHGFAGARF